jgi:zinc and cadmium transporter
MVLWFYTLTSVFVVSLISFVGILTMAIKEKELRGILPLLVSFSAGALFGGAFIHLIPGIIEETGGLGINTSLYIIVGILLFLILEKFIHWRHCHIPTSKSHYHSFGYMNIVGDTLHNFMDGIVIAGSYIMNIQLGIATTIAVILHEVPQEIGDFGVLLHAGFSKKKALMYNFISALASVFGAVITLFIGGSVQGLSNLIVPLTAGGFIYIAGSDLIPELNKECAPDQSIAQILSFIVGLVVMYGLTLI